MIFESELWFVSIDPGTCFWRTKSARNSMKAFAGRGMYPCDSRLPAGMRLRLAEGAATGEGGKIAPSGEGGSGVSSVGSGSIYVPGVTFGAKMTLRGDGDAIPYFPGLICVRPVEWGAKGNQISLVQDAILEMDLPFANDDRLRRETRVAGIVIVFEGEVLVVSPSTWWLFPLGRETIKTRGGESAGVLGLLFSKVLIPSIFPGASGSV